MQELQIALKMMKFGRYAGTHDQITPHILKYVGEKGERALLSILQTVWRTEVILEDWKFGIIMPI